MADLYLYNSLTRSKEKFVPITPPKVGIYTCGPTVYDYPHIGNYRTWTTSDILVRLLGYNAYQVTHVMNLTDVGHLTGDNLGDADTGEDRMEKSAKKEGRTAWDVAKFYTDVFLADLEQLNIKAPSVMPKATDHIKEQIALVTKLEENGLTYKTKDGVYFNTLEFEKKTGKKYGELSTLDVIQEGARVEANAEKKNPRDFALWKYSPEGIKRDMEWESPWGMGFPGWHIECSAMSMQYLGESFDIHVGGEDLRSTHHPNEIAQAEGATGKTFVNYWMHVTFLLVNGARMSKSKGNAFKLSDILEKGYDPLALRYLYLTSHYRDSLNFTWEALHAAQTSLDKLRNLLQSYKEESPRSILSSEKLDKADTFRDEITKSLNDDLNTSKAVAMLWTAIKSNIPNPDKYDLAISTDEVLGLNLGKLTVHAIPDDVTSLVDLREKFRKEGKFEESDQVRKEIQEKGFSVQDSPDGPKIKPIRNQ